MKFMSGAAKVAKLVCWVTLSLLMVMFTAVNNAAYLGQYWVRRAKDALVPEITKFERPDIVGAAYDTHGGEYISLEIGIPGVPIDRLREFVSTIAGNLVGQVGRLRITLAKSAITPQSVSAIVPLVSSHPEVPDEMVASFLDPNEPAREALDFPSEAGPSEEQLLSQIQSRRSAVGAAS